MIETENLSAVVGAFSLRDVTFVVPGGAYGVVIGPAGSGKTTLLETIAGITPRRSGTLRLRGADAASLPPERRGIGLVYQHGYLFPHLSVEQNIAYGARDAATSPRLDSGSVILRNTRQGGSPSVRATASYRWSTRANASRAALT